jgi:hypothetical protein
MRRYLLSCAGVALLTCITARAVSVAEIALASPVGMLLIAPVSPETTTWNPSDKSSAVTLSNGNLTASNPATSSFNSVRATASHTAGQYYFEATLTQVASNQSIYIGVANSSASLTTYFGKDTNSIICANYDGKCYFNSSNVGNWGSFTSGSTAGIAVDISNREIYFYNPANGYWNNSSTANPATGVGGISLYTISGALFPGVSINYYAANSVLVNFGATAFTYSPPAGFGKW